MAEHTGLPVKGYNPQSDDKVALVNVNKETEERILRMLDILSASPEVFDTRWVSIARTHFQEGFMAMNRAVFQPGRIALPEDAPTTGH